MNKHISRIRLFAVLPVALLLYFAPHISVVFGGFTLVMAVWGWGFGGEAAVAYMSIAWIVYALSAAFTIAFVVVYDFMNCCRGFNSIGNHLKHWLPQSSRYLFLEALLWPAVWYSIHREQKLFGSSFADAVIDASGFVFKDGLKGMDATVVNMQSGEVTQVRVKSPDEAYDLLKKTILATDDTKQDS